MNKYEKWGCMSADDLMEACIKLEEERDQVLKRVDELVESIAFQDPAVQAYYDELKTKLNILSMDIELS